MKKISICIPAYKRPVNIIRLLHSVAIQTFKDYEVIVTDDSPDDSVENAIKDFSQLSIRYYKNFPSLGTPANWNYCIGLAKGEWIKIMHDDDWFIDENSLQKFAEKTGAGKPFILSRYKNIFENGTEVIPAFPSSWKSKIIQQPVSLLVENVIGPPSVTLIHHSIKEKYDERMKWRVDLDFYIRLLLQDRDYNLIEETLINVGISSTQVTNDCLNMPEVEIPEGFLLLEKYGISPLKNISIYDAWWRILRNNRIRAKGQLKQYVSSDWPPVIYHMISHQQMLPEKILQIGAVSKPAMFISYLLNQRYLRQ